MSEHDERDARPRFFDPCIVCTCQNDDSMCMALYDSICVHIESTNFVYKRSMLDSNNSYM
jgi:hypothetical protein